MKSLRSVVSEAFNQGDCDIRYGDPKQFWSNVFTMLVCMVLCFLAATPVVLHEVHFQQSKKALFRAAVSQHFQAALAAPSAVEMDSELKKTAEAIGHSKLQQGLGGNSYIYAEGKELIHIRTRLAPLLTVSTADPLYSHALLLLKYEVRRLGDPAKYFATETGWGVGVAFILGFLGLICGVGAGVAVSMRYGHYLRLRRPCRTPRVALC